MGQTSLQRPSGCYRTVTAKRGSRHSRAVVRVAPTLMLRRIGGRRLRFHLRGWLERVIAERPEIAGTRHYHCALAAELSVLELADIYARQRKPDLRVFRTCCSVDLKHADAFREAVREFTAIHVAVRKTVRANAIRPVCRYLPWTSLLS